LLGSWNKPAESVATAGGFEEGEVEHFDPDDRRILVAELSRGLEGAEAST
jgi:hypothetical protein